jgi:hypothetical protein
MPEPYRNYIFDTAALIQRAERELGALDRGARIDLVLDNFPSRLRAEAINFIRLAIEDGTLKDDGGG